MVYKPTSLYIDPTKRTQEMEEFGIRTLPEFKGSAYNLGAVEGFPDVRYATTDYGKYSDLYRLYSGMPGGFDAAQDDFVTPPAAPPGGGDSGGGGVGTGGGTGGVNTPFEQNLIDQGIGVQTEPGTVVAPGEMPVTQAEMDEFNRRPVNTDYRNQQLVNQGIGVRVGDTGPVFAPGEAPVTQYEIDQYNRTPGSRVTPMDPTQMIPQISTYTPGQTIAGDVYAGGDYSDVAGTLGDPLEKQNFISAEDAADPKGLLSRLGITGFDPKEAAVKAAINAAVGGPITLFLDALKGLVPPQDPRVGALEELYPDRTSAGTIASGLMKGYNPVSGGFPGVSEPTYGLQDAYQKRIDTINRTLGKMTLEEYQNTDLVQRKKDLEEAMAKEKGRLDLFSGDIDDRDQMLEDIVAQNKAEAEGDAIRLRQLTGDVAFDDDTDIGTMDAVPETQAIIPLGEEDKIEIKDISKPNWLIEDQKKSKENMDQWLDKTQKTADDLAVEEIADIADRQPEVIEQKKNELANIYDRDVQRGIRPEDPTITSDINKAKEVIDMPQMLGDVGGSMDNRPPERVRGIEPTRTVSRTDTDYGQFGRRQEATSAGGGNDGGSDDGGGKSIVCTAMYQTTGLEDWSKAMKIWYIYQKKYLTIQHQEGYHKLFKPFVKGMHKSSIIKAIGAHVARHRTQDLKHVMFGSKPSWLGRIYRKILEPICYWAGKNVKK